MVSSYLWTLNGVNHNSIDDLTPLSAVRPQAQTYKFTFAYKGKNKHILVAAEPGVSRSEVEDRAAKAAEDWMEDLDQQEHKRPPTTDEKKQIGKALNDFLTHAKKRRESGNNTLYFPGVN